MTTQSAVCSFFLSSILSLNSRQLFLSLKTWLGREWRDGRQRERQRGNKSACRIAIEKADGIDPNHDGQERRRERMRDGGEGEGEASEAALWDRWAPGVRVGLRASLSCCSPIAPHSRRLSENEGSIAACQREKRQHFETIRKHIDQYESLAQGKHWLNHCRGADTFCRKTYCHDAGMSVHYIK